MAGYTNEKKLPHHTGISEGQFQSFHSNTTKANVNTMRPFFFILGWILFAIGFVGAFVPVLPTTPLMLLGLWCCSRSSDRFHDWLFNHRVFGPPLQQWHDHRVIPLSAKIISALFMSGSLVYVFLYSESPVWVKVIMSATMAVGFWFILTKPSVPPEK